jgi:hypothetical protein
MLAGVLKNQRTNWKQYDEFILNNYVKLGAKKCAEILGINKARLQSYANKKLGLKCFSHNSWSKKEENFIFKNYPKYGGRFCADKLKRSVYACHKKAQELGVKYIPKHRCLTSQGYVIVKTEEGNKLEHRFVMEQKLGRKLTSKEIVHHKDEDKGNNSPNNLKLTTRKKHINRHRKDLIAGQLKANKIRKI